MGYQRADGKWADTESVVLTPATNPFSTDVTGPAIELGDRARLSLTLDITAFAPTSLDVTIQGSFDGSTYFTLGTFTQATGTGTQRKTFGSARFVRASYNHTGSGAITLSLTGEAA
jgi:hypothetical protein